MAGGCMVPDKGKVQSAKYKVQSAKKLPAGQTTIPLILLDNSIYMNYLYSVRKVMDTCYLNN